MKEGLLFSEEDRVRRTEEQKLRREKARFGRDHYRRLKREMLKDREFREKNAQNAGPVNGDASSSSTTAAAGPLQ